MRMPLQVGQNKKVLLSFLSICAAAGLLSAQGSLSLVMGASPLSKQDDGVQVNTQVRPETAAAWTSSGRADPGDMMQYLISYKNTSAVAQKDVVIRDNLPPNVTIVPGTTQLRNGTHPDGMHYDSETGVVNGGIMIGTYAPNAAAYVWFQVKMPSAASLDCGVSTLRNVGIARPSGMGESYDTALVDVSRTCAAAPVVPKPSTPVVAAPKPTVGAAVSGAVSTPPVATTTTTPSAPAVTATPAPVHAPKLSEKDTGPDGVATSGGKAGPSVTKPVTAPVKAPTTINNTNTTTVVVTPPTPPAAPTPAPAPVAPVIPAKVTYGCASLLIQSYADRTITAMMNLTNLPDNVSFNSVTFDYGDSSPAFTTDFKIGNHTYTKDGTYTVTATTNFSVYNGTAKTTVTTHDGVCAQTVSVSGTKVLAATANFPTTSIPATTTTAVATTTATPVVAAATTSNLKNTSATVLPNTGAGNVIGLFLGVSALGYGLHYVVRRKLGL